MTTLQWHDQDVINGIQVKAFFFDGDAAAAEPSYVRRVLPMLANAPVKPVLLTTEGDRKNLFFEQLVAQADSVVEHGNGLICLEYKSGGGRDHARQNWRLKIKLVAMLQAIIASYVVAQTHRKVTACVLRYHNVAYLLTPSEALINLLVSLVPQAMVYYQDRRCVAAAQLASFALERVKKEFPRAETAAQAAGRAAHEAMLKRDDE
jgi:hypothetical protein